MLLLQWGPDGREPVDNVYWILSRDSVADGPSDNTGCMLDSLSTARINVQEWASESNAYPTVNN